MTRRNKIILLLILLALECVLLFWCRNRYMTVLSSGTVYESPASVDFKPDFAERNYLSVYIPVTSAVWVGKECTGKRKGNLSDSWEKCGWHVVYPTGQ